MSQQGGKKKPATTHVAKGRTEKYYIDSLADQAAGIRQVDPDSESRWTPEDDMTMTKDIGSHLRQDFSLDGPRKQRAPPPRSPPPRQQQPQRPPPAKPRTRPAPPPAKASKPPAQQQPLSRSKEIVAKARIISDKYKRGELSADQYKSMRKKLTGMVDEEIAGLEKKVSVLENKFLNNQVSMEKYNSLFDSLNKEIKRLRELREKVSPG